MAIGAFGVPVINQQGSAKTPPAIVQEINVKLKEAGIPSDNVINIQATEGFYHVFYRTTA